MHAVVGPLWQSNPWTAAYRQDRLEPSERPVGWLSGSCLLLRGAAFDEVGGFDERYFMYMEDVDLGDRLGRAGWQNVYVPSAEILHDKGHSTGRDPARNLAAHHESTYTFLSDRHTERWQAPLRWTMRGALEVRSRLAVQKSVDERRRDGTSLADSINPAEVDAVILVGGQGTRLRPLTLSAPKPMLPTAGLPFLTHLLSRIAAAGIEHVVLGTSYKAAVFESEFGDGSKLGLQIDYVVEDEPLGTGGGIANVAPKLRHDTAMVFNGDVLSGADLGALLATPPRPRRRCDPAPGPGRRPAGVRLRAHRCRRRGHRVPGEDRGSADRPDQRRLLRVQARGHRPHAEGPGAVGGARGVPGSCWPTVSRCAGTSTPRYWRDMGTPEDFVRGSADLVRGIAPSPALQRAPRRESLVHDGAAVAPGALLIGGTVVGRGAEIGPGVRLDGAVIFDGVAHRGGFGDRALDHRLRRPHRTARADPRRRDRRRRRHRRALRAAARCPGVAGGGHPRRRHPLLDRHLTSSPSASRR